ncbi:MAG: TIGR03086 family metal-binding protein [Pseudonocardia sp.]
MEMLGLYEKALDNSGRILRGIRGHHLGRPTPCAGWDVNALLGHLISHTQMYGAGGLAAGEVFVPAEAGEDPGWAYAIAAKAALRTFSTPGAAERTFRLPAGEVPGSVAIGLAMTEAAVHGWDIATATGKSATIDSDVAEALLAFHRSAVLEFQLGQDAAFGPEVPVDADRSASDRLVGLFGRQV